MDNPLKLLTTDDTTDTVKFAYNLFENQRQQLEKKHDDDELNKIAAKMPGVNVRKLSPIALDDARLVNRIDEDYKRINNYLIKTKNTCTFSEYRDNWFPLHELMYPEMPDYERKVQERRALSEEYFQRFISTAPITIVDDYDPNKILAVIPPQYIPINTIQGDASRVIDQFTYHAGRDQENFTVQTGNLLSKLIGVSQQNDPEQINKIRMICFEANLKVLKLFNPDHPLLKKIEELEKKKQENEVKVIEKQKGLKSIKTNNNNDTNVIDDNTEFDFF